MKSLGRTRSANELSFANGASLAIASIASHCNTTKLSSFQKEPKDYISCSIPYPSRATPNGWRMQMKRMMPEGDGNRVNGKGFHRAIEDSV